MIAAILPCLVFLAGWIAGVLMGSRERNRQRKEIQILREDVTAWKHAAVYWQQRAGFRITPDRPSPAEEIDFRLDCKRAAKAKERKEWGRKVSEDIAELLAGGEGGKT